MAGIAPLPEPMAGGAGLFSRLARSQYGALARMRFQMLANNARSVQGAFELGARSVTFLIYSLMGLGLGAGLGISAYIMASRDKWQPLPILFWVVFIVWQALPIVLASFQEQFDLSGLLRFPVNFASFYLLQLVFGLVDVPVLLGSLCCLGIGIGIVFARPDYFFWTVLILTVFALFNIVAARAVFAWIDRWLAQRRTREIVSAVILLLVLSLQLLNPALYQNGPHGPRTHNSHSGLQRSPREMPPWKRRLSVMVQWLPPGLAADGLHESVEHHPAHALGSLGILGLYILGAGAFLLVRLRAEFGGENLNEAPVLSRVTDRDRRWLIDGSGPIAAVIEKELRIIPRAMPMLFAMGAPLITVLIIGTVLRNSVPQGIPPFRLAFPLCVSYTLLGFTPMIYNNLGAEGTGIQILFLSPTPMRTVLLAKNLFHALLYGSIAVVAAIFAASRLGWPDGFLLATTAAWLLFALPANLAAGNLLSLTMPYRMNLGRLSRQRGSQASALISMLVQLGVIATGLAVFELCAFIGRIWLAPLVFLLLSAAMIFIWMEVLRRSDSLAERNKDVLIGALAKRQ
jgi:ABC-2 type transport system permease protein